MSNRTIAILTAGRSDFGRYRPVLSEISGKDHLKLRLLVTGGHYSPSFGHTIDEIEESGFTWEPGLEMTLDADTPGAVGKSIGIGALSLSQAFSYERPDLLVILGDRYEMLAGACAAIGFNIPIAHMHGGAVTEGAIDELVRHALTKMSHIHFAACEEYGKRILQMGEEPWRVHITGAPILDGLKKQAQMSLEKISERLDIDLQKPPILVCFHPVTVESGQSGSHIANLLNALDQIDEQIIITYPNVDHGRAIIISALESFAKANPERIQILKNAGTKLYTSILANAQVLVGNSSSGIVEAATFETPVVNIGTRQHGKVKPNNVIDCDYESSAILDAINKAKEPVFRRNLIGMKNPYGDGKSGPRIAKILETILIDDKLLRKKFVDF